jgi:hypothetical protein
MTEVHKLDIRSTEDPLFNDLARMVNPQTESPYQKAFVPAYAGFNIADGTDVDISYYFDPSEGRPWQSPRKQFDRHLRTEELWVVTEGDFYLPLMACEHPDDPEDRPDPKKMLCFRIKKGDLFVLKPNVWHCGPWAARSGEPVQFYMFLSGHRAASKGGNVDHLVRPFVGDVAILPNVNSEGAPV